MLWWHYLLMHPRPCSTSTSALGACAAGGETHTLCAPWAVQRVPRCQSCCWHHLGAGPAARETPLVALWGQRLVPLTRHPQNAGCEEAEPTECCGAQQCM